MLGNETSTEAELLVVVVRDVLFFWPRFFGFVCVGTSTVGETGGGAISDLFNDDRVRLATGPTSFSLACFSTSDCWPFFFSISNINRDTGDRERSVLISSSGSTALCSACFGGEASSWLLGGFFRVAAGFFRLPVLVDFLGRSSMKS